MPSSAQQPSILRLLIALLFGCISLIACNRDELLTVTLTQAELQQHIAQAFPVKRATGLAQLTLDEPKVTLAEGSDRIGLELRATVALPLIPVQQGRIAISGVPEYRQAEKAFYFIQPRLDRITIPGISGAQLELVKAPLEAVASSALGANAVYKLEDRNFNEAAVGRVLTGVTVRDGRLVLTLGLPH